jgi:hypothetical protein
MLLTFPSGNSEGLQPGALTCRTLIYMQRGKVREELLVLLTRLHAT